MADLVQIGFVADSSGIDKANDKLNKLAKTGDKADKSIDKSSKGMSRAFAAVGAAVGTVAAAALSLNKLVSVTRQFDILNAQLITATGSAGNAAGAFEALQGFAAKTPYDLQQVTESFTKLVNLGLTPSERALTSYGNTASAMGKDLNQLIEAVADAATGEFERLKEFGIKSKQQGDSVAFTFRGVTTTVKKNSQEIEGYLMALGENQFAGAMEQRMDSLDGAISNLSDTWDGLYRAVSQKGAGDLIREAVEFATGAIQDLTDSIKSGQLGAYFDAFIGKFEAFANAARLAFEIVGVYWDDLTQSIAGEGGGLGQAIIDSLVNIPENVAAIVQIMAVEFGALVDKAMINGEQIAWALNPLNWLEDMPDFSARFDAVNVAREDSIMSIMRERDAALDSFDSQIKAADDLRFAYDNAGSSAFDLGQFSKQAAIEATTGFEYTAAEINKLFKDMGDDPFTDAFLSDDDLAALTASVDDFGGAWTRTGSAIVDAFGGMAGALEDYSLRMDAITKQEIALAAAKEQAIGDEAKIKSIMQLEKKMADERTKANLSGYSKMAGAAASMFKEQSKGREAMNKAEKAFAAVEIALALQKAGANALTAITSAFSAPFPVNFAAGAAMIGIMSGLGLFSGSSGSGAPSAEELQASAGTGTVMGDPSGKSESIANSVEEYSEIAIDQLAELRGIRDAMVNLSDGIARLAVSLVTSKAFAGANVSGLGTIQNDPGKNFGGLWKAAFGDDQVSPLAAGLFGSTKKKILDTGINFNTQELGDILGGKIMDATYYTTIETTKKKIFGLVKKVGTKDELSSVESVILEDFGRIFGFIGDAVMGSVEALGVDAENSIEDFVVSLGKLSFKDLSGDEIQAQLEAIFSQQADLIAEFVLPSIKQYQQMGEGAFETITRLAREQTIFNDALGVMGLSLGDLSNMLRIDVAQSIITMMGGLEDFSAKTSEYFDKFFTDSEKLDALSSSLNDAFDSLGVAMPMTRDGFRELIEGLDLTTETGQMLFASLMELVPGLDEYITAIDRSGDALATAAEKADALSKAADTEIYNSLVSRVKAEQKLLEGQQREAENALKSSFEAEKDAVKDALGARINALNSYHDAEMASLANRKEQAQQLADSLRTASNEIMGAYDAITGGMSAQDAQNNIQDALRKAWAGDFSGATNLSGSLEAVRGGTFGSKAEADVFNARTAFALSTLGGLTGAEASVQERTLAQLERAEGLSTVRHEQSIAQATMAAQAQIDRLDMQLNELLGIDTTVMILNDAIAGYQDAQQAANDFNYESQIAILDTARSQLGELERMNNQMELNNQTIQAALIAIAKHTSATASTLQRTELSGTGA